MSDHGSKGVSTGPSSTSSSAKSVAEESDDGQSTIFPFRTDPDPNTNSGTSVGSNALSPQFQSYVEYLQYLSLNTHDIPCFGWLLEFFTTLPNPDELETEIPPTKSVVIDMLDHGWRVSHKITRQTLENAAGVSARIVVIECQPEQMAWVDRQTLDTAAFYYSLNPIYLWGALFNSSIDRSYGSSSQLGNIPFKSDLAVPLVEANDTRIVELAYSAAWHGETIALVQSSMFGFYLTETPNGIPTCLILSTSGSTDAVKSLSAHYISKSLHPIKDNNAPLPNYETNLDVYRDMLLSFNESKCRDLAKSPAVFILIYLNLSLHTFSQNVTALFKVFTRWNIRAPGHIIEDISTLKIASSRALKSVEDFASDNGAAGCPETAAVVAELKRLGTSINGLSERVVNHTNALAVSASLDESRKAIQMTDSVKLLTQLAFIFIPLTFSASIFGMNFEELGSGSLHITSFVSTAFAVTGTTLVALWVSRALSGKRRALVKFALSFSLYSPRRAFLLTVFLVFGTIDTSWGDLNGFSGADAFLRCIDSDFDKADNFAVSDITTSDRWQAWLLPFEKFVADPEWKEQYAWQRWARAWKASIGAMRFRVAKSRGQAKDHPEKSAREGDSYLP